jgi:hypothetical protein
VGTWPGPEQCGRGRGYEIDLKLGGDGTAPSGEPLGCSPSPGALAARISHWQEVTCMRYLLEVRITAADVGKRVAIRWRPAELAGSSQWMTDVLGILEEADDQFFKVRRGRDGQLVVIPRERALAGKVVPPAPPPRRPSRAPRSS